MENNSQAIEIKGIVRNQTKIGVQDGQCDDLVNLRFKDGSWRVADDGKQVYQMPSNTTYSQLYVHTNVYHHLLGVSNDKLYWFANIETDGETFTNLDNPVEICDVQGDVTIVENGHLITIISLVSSLTTPLPLATSSQSEERISYAIFVTGTNEYKVLNVNANGEQTDRGLYPFGKVHLNLDCGTSEKRTFIDTNPDAGKLDLVSNYNSAQCSISEYSGLLYPKKNEDETHEAAKLWHSSMLKAFKKAKENNYFTSPFLAVVAFKLYDGSFVCASNPILLNPRERLSDFSEAYDIDKKEYIYREEKDFHFQRNAKIINHDKTETKENDRTYVAVDTVALAHYGEQGTGDYYGDSYVLSTDRPPVYTGDAQTVKHDHQGGASGIINDYIDYQFLTSTVVASSIIMTLGDITPLDSSIFKSLCVFVTPEAYMYDMSDEGYKESSFKQYSEAAENGTNFTLVGNLSYRPHVREKEEIIHELTHSNFYLLREYSLNELSVFAKTSIEVDLSDIQFKGILDNIEQQEVLQPEAFGRSEYTPKVAYSYNQKLHIANYKSGLFHGYPIDLFQFNNHNIKISEGDYAIIGVIPNAKDDVDFQYPRERTYFANSKRGDSGADDQGTTEYIENADKYGIFFAEIAVELETSNGYTRVVRYIKPYNSNEVGNALSQPPFKNGDYAHFVESLSPLLSYPDTRATSMSIGVNFLLGGKVQHFNRNVALKPHPYLNIAYYIDPEIKPIELEKSFEITLAQFNDNEKFNELPTAITNSLLPVKEINAKENFPNGLKVSAVNNPFFFPYETTYQVGSSEIVALMSNAVAVGTGQTGAAPLYVFCKDGIYALMVDSTGEMAYTNARIVARDVCNNAKSVTPIDSGVVFTTDRGIMSISGSEVVEIGSAAEGDVFDITDTSDKAKKIMFNAFAMQQLAEFPQSLVDNTDFLTYLKGAIINYNHNERELMVSNPNKDYTYVMDRYGNWSRRAFTAQEYVNNYPTSYRIDKSGNFYKVDADDNDMNKVYLLSNIIKLGTIAFKQAYRLVVRGYFETEDDAKLGLYVFGSYDGRQWALLGGNEKDQTYNQGKFTDIGCKISHTDIRFLRVCLAGKLSKNSRIDYIEVSLDGSMLNGKLR